MFQKIFSTVAFRIEVEQGTLHVVVSRSCLNPQYY